MSLIATLVAGCDEPRRTLVPTDVNLLTDLSGDAQGDDAPDAPSERDGAASGDVPQDAPARDATVGDAPDVPDVPTALDVVTADVAPDLPDASAPTDIATDLGADAGPPRDAPSVPRASPTIDGVLGSDWPDGARLAVNTEPSPWGPTLNALRSLRVAWDETNLYLGLDAVVEAQNAIVVYLDRDHVPGGAATGVTRIAALSDGNGALDDALSAAIEMGPAGFGAEFGWGTLGMQRKGASELRADIGLRDIACPRCAGDFGWIQGDVAVCGTGANAGCEVAIPWTSVYGASGLPPVPHLALFARLVSASGAELAPGQCLPPQSAPAATVGAVLSLSPAR